MAFILAKKVKMEQRYRGDEVVPVTILEVLPCIVTQVRTVERDGYRAIQVGAGARRKVTKPMAGHFSASSSVRRSADGPTVDGAGMGKFRWLREFDEVAVAGKEYGVGDRIDADVLKVGDAIQVSSVSKGKGFQGVVKRHHFHGQDATHGTKDQVRMPGSLAGIGRGGGGPVSKGRRMAGRMGGERVTVKGLEVVAVDTDRHKLVVKGAVPGARGALVEVRTWGGSWR